MSRLGVVLVCSAALASIGAAPATAVARSDDAGKPVVFLAGIEEAAPLDCSKLWDRMQRTFTTSPIRWGRQVHEFRQDSFASVGYRGSTRCSENLDVGDGDSVETAARRFAEWLARRYGTTAGDEEGTGPRSVDVVAHGTGGLIARYAVAMQGEPGWPEAVPIEDAVTLGAPHQGSDDIAARCRRRICRQMDSTKPAGQELLATLGTPEFASPQSPGGTDWSTIASTGDTLVPTDSALGMSANHETLFLDASLGHAALVVDSTTAVKRTIRSAHRGNAPRLANVSEGVVQRVARDLVFGDWRLTGSDAALERYCRSRYAADLCISFELDDAWDLPQPDEPQPGVSTAGRHVIGWLQHHERPIVAAEARWGVHRHAIAAAIAWEALENVHSRSLRGAGAGKVHYWNNAVVDQVEARGYLAKRGILARKAELEKPEGALSYIGAIMRAYTDVARARGFDIACRPEILTNAYHGVAERDGKEGLDAWDAHLKAKAERTPPERELRAGNLMGLWAQANTRFLHAAVGDPPLSLCARPSAP